MYHHSWCINGLGKCNKLAIALRKHIDIICVFWYNKMITILLGFCDTVEYAQRKLYSYPDTLDCSTVLHLDGSVDTRIYFCRLYFCFIKPDPKSTISGFRVWSAFLWLSLLPAKCILSPNGLKGAFVSSSKLNWTGRKWNLARHYVQCWRKVDLVRNAKRKWTNILEKSIFPIATKPTQITFCSAAAAEPRLFTGIYLCTKP